MAATLPALAGCSDTFSTLHPVGPRAGSIALLWWIMLAGSAVLLLLVLGLLAISLLRPQWLKRVTPRQWILGGGLMLPVPILAALTVAALALGEAGLPKPLAAAPFRVEGVARQWEWRFTYPDLGGRQSGTLLLPAGQPVDITVTSTDVIHSFWVPRLGGKTDAIPGHRNVTRMQADEAGVYRGICAEYCGPGHDTMGFVVEVHPEADLRAALEAAP